MNAFSRFTTIINLHNENMSLEMTIKKLGSVYKLRVGRATGNEHIFLFGLSILSLNCCGIKRRLQYDEFRELITCHDILCFQETKTDDIDVLELENYEFVMKNRKKYGRVNSGGIVLAFRNYLKDHITIHETECKSVLWFELSKNVTNFDNNLIVGIIYIPPENSKYSSRELFTNIGMEMHELVKMENT